MTIDEAKNVLITMRASIEIDATPIITHKDLCEALDLAIKALEKINHLIDRPCEACEFHKDNGCCKWGCVFEEGERKE